MRRGQTVAVGIVCVLFVGIFFAGCTPPEDTSNDETSAPETESASKPAAAPDEVETPGEPMAEVAQDDAVVDSSIRGGAEYGDDALLEGLAPDGWHQAGAIEHYNIARLYEKIDGRSELYMSYDVVGLSWASFVHDDKPNLFVDAFVYDMRSPTGAYGIYSVEREPGQLKLPLGREGYRTDSNNFFWKGKYYVYIQTSLDTEEAISTGYKVAQDIEKRLTDSGEEIRGLDLVPLEGMVDDTIQFFRSDAMSLDFMRDTYTVHYMVGDTEVIAFMTRLSSEEEAQDILTQYIGYLDDYGDEVSRHDADGTEITIADLGGGYFDGVFRKGNIVAGASTVEGAEATIAASKAILAKF